jgi:hypothetical protein
MSKKENLMKGFNNLLQSTESVVETPKKEVIKTSDAQTSKSINAQKYKRSTVAKYKELRKCTLYLPSEIIDSLAIMKIKTKKDLSELTAEALREYLTNNNFLNV